MGSPNRQGHHHSEGREVRRAAKVDANHLDICLALRSFGASVLSLASIGRGCPDICIGFRGTTYLAEIKNNKVRWSMTDDQKIFHAGWNAPILVLDSVESAEAWIRTVGKTK